MFLYVAPFRYEAWASKAGGGRGDASPAVEKSAGDVPPEMVIF